MKIAYFDCFSGVSGNMILGALIDAGLSLEELESELGKLNLSGYKVRAEKTERGEISGTAFSVDVTGKTADRNLDDILGIICQSNLDDSIKDSSRKIFEELAAVEAKIHNKDIGKIHFHEVGAVDSIIDVVGSMIGIKKLGISAVYSSKIHVGRGFVKCRHGVLPVPAPATVELLKGVPVYSNGIEEELTTPTGAVILKTVSRNFGNMPEMKVEKIGYGAGSRELKIPNLLRVYVGEAAVPEYEEDNVILIEANIDDMNPEFFEHVSEQLLGKGSLDVFLTPTFMKKGRPGVTLGVLTAQDKFDEILSTLFSETTTLGVRIHRLVRKKLLSEVVSVKTKFGNVKVKIGRTAEGVKNIAPEYDDCREIAVRCGIPLKDVYDEVRRAAQDSLASG